MESSFFIGCDISQDTFNYCLRDRNGILLQGQVANSQKAIKAWLNQLKKDSRFCLDTVLFGMEHTGVYGSILLRELGAKSYSVCVESAINIRLSLGLQRGKNDRVDAQRIAEYIMRNMDRLKRWQPKREVLNSLQLLIRLRERLVKSKTELSRFNQDASKFLTKQESQLVIQGSKKPLEALTKAIKKADSEIESLIRKDENLNHLAELVTSVDSIGMVTCSAILVKTNEFKDFTEAKKFACTSGIAPFEHSSGKSIRGKTRVSHSAHKDMKKLLHLCALGAISRKGDLRDYYDRKLKQGKNKMLVLNAIRNKLVHRIFAVVRDNTMYQKNYQYNLEMA
ncbi:MAG TPA: IS110 family transposase [Saprospiraceae bacterium]|nr:IS110 family transposase [Saprospiraceae bacterium]